MIQGVNSILCYGMNIGGEDEGFSGLDADCAFSRAYKNGETSSVEEYVFGVLLTAAGFLEPEPPLSWPTEADKEVWRAWYRRREEADEALPVEIVAHFSGGNLMYILAARPVFMARHGRPEVIDLAELVAPDARAARETALSSALDVLGMVPKTSPSWLLASYRP